MKPDRPWLMPAFLKVAGRDCLVVGGGAIATEKVMGLLACDAKVTIISPEVHECLMTLVDDGLVTLVERRYQAGDAADYFVVIAATNEPEVNLRVYNDGASASRLVNVVDVPELCDFYVPSIVRKGDLQLAISTGGASPGIAKRLRQQFESELSDAYGPLLKALREFREELKEIESDSKKRMRLNKEIASSEAINQFLAGNEIPLQEALKNALTASRN